MNYESKLDIETKKNVWLSGCNNISDVNETLSRQADIEPYSFFKALSDNHFVQLFMIIAGSIVLGSLIVNVLK